MLPGIQGMLTALAWFKGLPPGFIDRHIEQSQQSRKALRQGTVQRQERVGDLRVPLMRVITGLDVKIHLEDVDDGEIGSSRAVGEPATDEHAPAVSMERLENLPDESGLAGAGLPNHPDDLPAASPRLSEGLREERYLSLTAYHRTEAPHRSSL